MTQGSAPKYRVEVWTLADDGHVTLRAVTLSNWHAVALFVLGVTYIRSARGDALPEIAGIQTVH